MGEAFQQRVDTLKNVVAVCDDAARIAGPYFEAAEWEKATGKNVAEEIGTHETGLAFLATGRIIDAVRNCSVCTVTGDIACQFAGVEKLTQEEILTLVN